jgi:hypothetical protein
MVLCIPYVLAAKYESYFNETWNVPLIIRKRDFETPYKVCSGGGTKGLTDDIDSEQSKAIKIFMFLRE